MNNKNYGVNPTVPYTHLGSMGILYGNGFSGPASNAQTSTYLEPNGALAGIAQGTTPTSSQPVISELVNNTTASPAVAEYAFASAQGNVKSDIVTAVTGNDWLRFCTGSTACGPASVYQVELVENTSTTGQWLPAVADGMSLGSATEEWGPAYLSTLNASGNDAVTANANTSGESIPSGVATTVTNWSTKFDRLGVNWNGSTGIFTTPGAGIYIVSVGLTFVANSAPAGDYFRVQVIGPSAATFCSGNTYSATASSVVYTVSTTCAVQATSISTIYTQAFQNTSFLRWLSQRLRRTVITSRSTIP